MKTRAFIILALVPLLSLQANDQDTAFEKIAKDYIEGNLALHPESATELGDHRFDAKLSDYSADGRAKELAREKKFRDQLNAFADYKKLTGPNQVDVRLIRDNIDYAIFQLEDLRAADWNPLSYNQSLANALYLLVARDFDKPEKRIANLQKRMEGIPGVIAQAKKHLQN